MPLVACPKCTTKLRVADGPVGAVRCPKCQTVFQPPKPAQPAFEVVEEPPRPAPKPAPPPKPAPSAARPAPSASRPASPSTKPAPKPAAPPEFEVVEEPPKSAKRVAARDAEEEDDRPRKRRREDDEDDEDDRPRGRRRSRDDDDDDDRPRGKRRRDDDDEYDNYDRGRGPKVAGAGSAKVGLLMLLISLGLYAGSLVLHVLLLFVAWLGGVIPNGLVLTTGLIGLANWVVALIGLGFCIAGPARSRGLAIAATSVAVVHLILAFVVANDTKSGMFSSHSIQGLSLMNRAERIMDLQKEAAKNPSGAAAKELREMQAEAKEEFEGVVVIEGDEVRTSRSKMRWQDLTTLLPAFDQFIAVLSYRSKVFSDYLLGMFGGLAELARFVLIVLMIGSMAGAVKAHDAADKAKVGVIAGGIAAVVCLLVVLLTAVIIDSYSSDLKKAFTDTTTTRPPEFRPGASFQENQRQQEEWFRQMQAENEKRMDKFKSVARAQKNWGAAGELLVYLIHAGMLALPALAALQAYSAAARKAR